MTATSAPPDSLTRKVIGEAMYVHRVLGSGFLELIYHNALLLRLKKLGLKAESQKPLPVYFEDELIGEFFADIIIEDCLILELKAVSSLTTVHEVQLVNYLTATKIELVCSSTLEQKVWNSKERAGLFRLPHRVLDRINKIYRIMTAISAQPDSLTTKIPGEENSVVLLLGSNLLDLIYHNAFPFKKLSLNPVNFVNLV